VKWNLYNFAEGAIKKRSMQVQILGNGSGGMFIDRYFSAQVLTIGRYGFLIDCGEGAQMQVVKYKVKIAHINTVLISHLHGDHVLGLIGLISTYSMQQRTTPLHVYGPEGLDEFLRVQIKTCHIYLTYTLDVHVVSTAGRSQIIDHKDYTVTAFPLVHRIPAVGYRIETKLSTEPRVRAEAIETYGLSIEQIKAIKRSEPVVNQLGEQIDPILLTLPPKPTKSYAYCSDTTYSEEVIEAVRDVDLLYHEATFLEKDLDRASLTKHSTALDAARVAQKAGVKKLIMGHLSGRYVDFVAHEAEAQAVFAAAYGTAEGAIYEV
jgi:ribonuclease Z